MSYVIEKNIPMPAKGSRENGLNATLRQMMPGESVLVTDSSVSNVSSQAVTARHKTGKTYTTRKVEGGVRVWCMTAPEVKP